MLAPVASTAISALSRSLLSLVLHQKLYDTSGTALTLSLPPALLITTA
ncbi:MAG: hypothetical protein QXK43_08460 [Candidatus Jordarchaeales archaeon]